METTDAEVTTGDVDVNEVTEAAAAVAPAVDARAAERAAEEAIDAGAYDESDDAPFDVNDEVDPDEMGDLSDQKSGSDAIEPVKGVRFLIKKAALDVIKGEYLRPEEYAGPDGKGKPFLVKQLRVQATIADEGIDGTGRYAGKMFFPDFRLVINFAANELNHNRAHAAGKKPKPYNADWWKKEARADTKEFLLAVGVAEIDENGKWKSAPINDDVLVQLAGGDTYFVADVTKEKDNLHQGEFRNVLRRFRAATSDEVAAE